MKKPTIKKKFRAEYQALLNAIDRCTRTSHPQYDDYGGRGLSVSEDFTCRTTGFVTFLVEVGKKPHPEWTLERKCNDLGYIPGNLVWASRSDNAQNRRPKAAKVKDLGWGIRKVLTIRKDGVEQQYSSPLLPYDDRVQTVRQWSEETGLSVRVITQRFNRGWAIEDVLQPVLLSPWRKPRHDQTVQ